MSFEKIIEAAISIAIKLLNEKEAQENTGS